MNAYAERYRDAPRTPLAVSLSLLLHGLVALALVAYFWGHPPIVPPPSPTMMIFPSPSDEAQSPAGPTTEESNSQVSPLPNLKETPIVISPPAPPTPPAPTPPAPTPPQPSPPPPPKPSSNRGQIQPKPAPTTPKTYTYTDYLKAHPQTTAKPASVSNNNPARGQTSNPIKVGIDASNIINGVKNIGENAGGPVVGPSSPGQQDINNYLQMLVARLQAVFTPPPGVAGLQAEVSLTIDPDGRVVGRALTGKSGNAKFDAAVQAALDSLTDVDPPPTGKQETYNFTYQPDRN